MSSYYLQFGLRPLAPKEERRTHSDEPGIFLDDTLYTFNKVTNQLVDTIEADTWIQAREQVDEIYLFAFNHGETS